MEEVADNLTQDDVLDLIGKFPLEPIRNQLIISVNTTDAELDLDGHGFDESQYVIAKGSHVFENIKAGGKVLLDLEKMSVKTQHEDGDITFVLQIKPVKVEDRVFAIINDTYVLSIDNR